MSAEIQIVVPGVSDDEWSEGLYSLVGLMGKSGIGLVHGFLGGEFGYGADYESDIFMMHHFCWCESEECPWCCGCECPEEAFLYFVDGVPVSYEEFDNFFDKETYQKLSGGEIKSLSDSLNYEDEPYSHEEWEAAADAANKRRERKKDESLMCDFCLGKYPSPETGAVHNFQGAPNFWHKSSGVRVWWYKYIGRGMEIHNPNNVEPSVILNECAASLSDKH